jgi:ribosomal protein S18 acetylase RimI-like enzyme
LLRSIRCGSLDGVDTETAADADTAAEVAVELLDPAASQEAALVQQLTDLVNDVYAVAEKGLWQDGTPRTTTTEIAGLVAAGEIAVATAPDGTVVGSIHLHRIAPDTSEFGMLVAAPDRRGAGIGRALVAFAERTSREQGLRAIQLELLVPREGRHPSKELLAEWYGRIGYPIVRIGRIDDAHPHLAPFLATPCDVQVREKPLGGLTTRGAASSEG